MTTSLAIDTTTSLDSNGLSKRPSVTLETTASLDLNDPYTDVSFNIYCKTTGGDEVFLCGEGVELGNWNPNDAVQMYTSPSVYPVWTLTCRLYSDKQVKYQYLIKTKDSQIQWENPHLQELISSDNTNMSIASVNVITTTTATPSQWRQVIPSGVHTVIDDGKFGLLDSRKRCSIDKGWLQEGETELRIIVGNREFTPVHIVGDEDIMREGCRLRMTMTPYGSKLKSNPNDQEKFEMNPFLMDVKVLHPGGNGWTSTPTGSARISLDSTPFVGVTGPDSGSDNPARTPFSRTDPLSFNSVLQPRRGFVWTRGDVAIFSARIMSGFKDMAVLIEILRGTGVPSDSKTKSSSDSDIIGSSFLIPSLLFSKTAGNIVLPIFKYKSEMSSPVPIGEFCAEFLIATFFTHPSLIGNTATKARKIWVDGGRSLDIGHRGMGKSHGAGRENAYSTENTIYSLVRAANAGADFVEFDVQLTRDRHPIIYHNFFTQVSLTKDGSTSTEPFVVPVKDLTLAQLRRVRTDFVEVKPKMFQKLIKENLDKILQMGRKDTTTTTTDVMINEESIKSSSSVLPPVSPNTPKKKLMSYVDKYWKAVQATAPTLVEILKYLPPSVGFNVEVKYPVAEFQPGEKIDHPKVSSGDWEEKNDYVDRILKVLLENNIHNRKIVISCFDPQICTLFRLKQPLYPVFFLTCSGNPIYGIYRDSICQSLALSVLFAQSERLLGIVANSTPILHDHETTGGLALEDFVKIVHKRGLLLFTWGDENNINQYVNHQRHCGVDAVIMDHVGRIRRSREHPATIPSPPIPGPTSINSNS